LIRRFFERHRIILRRNLHTAEQDRPAGTPLMFSRYDTDMHYGSHVDDALMHGMRTDVSFTLFVSGRQPAAELFAHLHRDRAVGSRVRAVPDGRNPTSRMAISGARVERLSAETYPTTISATARAVAMATRATRTQNTSTLLMGRTPTSRSSARPRMR
jgi:hypothetical protein